MVAAAGYDTCEMPRKKPASRTNDDTTPSAAKTAKKKPSQKKAATREPRKASARPSKSAAKRRAASAESPAVVAEALAVAAELLAVAAESPDAAVLTEDVIAPAGASLPPGSAAHLSDAEVIDAEIISEVAVEERAAPPLTEEEQELTAIYGDDSSGPPHAAHQEYRDRLTRDEDRQLMPEISARQERKQHWQDRRERRKQRREERQRSREGVAQPGHARAQDDTRPNSAPPPRLHESGESEIRTSVGEMVNGNGHDTLARVGTPLGDAAATVFAQLRNSQPLPVRQLAAMMRKRGLVPQDPDQLWPQLKAELLGDERSYRSLGLRPRIVYRGRDLFAPGPVATSVTADAEASVAGALSTLAGATHRALARRIAKATAAGFERLIHAYLVTAGYRDIDWIKRVDGIGYAQATAPGLERPVLISARSGDHAIDRRGVGELRVGVEAKGLVAGILFAARELSDDAEQELERSGRSISVICGDLLVAELVSAGVGVVSAAAPLHYLDDQLLDELLAG